MKKIIDFVFGLTASLLFCFSPLIIIFSETVKNFKDSGGKEIKLVTATNDIGYFLIFLLIIFLVLTICRYSFFKPKIRKLRTSCMSFLTCILNFNNVIFHMFVKYESLHNHGFVYSVLCTYSY